VLDNVPASHPRCEGALHGHSRSGRLADGLVRIGEDAVAKSNDALFYDYSTDNYQLHGPAGDLNREEIRAYFAALRESFTDFTITRAQISSTATSPPRAP
jgi:hypothetical protein